MLALLILSLCAAGISAQTVCHCAVYTNEDKPGNRPQSLIALLGTPEVNALDCDEVDFTTTSCYTYCNNSAQAFMEGNGKCAPHFHEDKGECFGNTWCDRIASNSPGLGGEGTWVLSGYGRLSGCGNNAHEELVEIDVPQGKQTLCCDAMDAQDKCHDDDCTCDDQHLCDCGLFIDDLHGKWKPGANDAIPLGFIGTDYNGTYDNPDDWFPECQWFPSNPDDYDNADPCTKYCVDVDIEQFSLADKHPNNEALTRGDVMCTQLFHSVGSPHYHGFENEGIFVHGRVKDCPQAGIGWSTVFNFGVVPELLCCTEEGTWYACP